MRYVDQLVEKIENINKTCRLLQDASQEASQYVWDASSSLLPVSNILHKKRQELENEYERIAGKRWRQ
jgi:hypothetical protein